MKIFDLFFAARPLLHLPVWSIYLVSLHYHLELSNDSFSIYNLLMIVCLSLIVAGAYYLNQIYDYESDRINKKLGFLQMKILRSRHLWKAFFIASIIPFAITPVYSFWIFMIFAQQFVLGVLYSAPPLRLKDRPIAGLFVNAFTFGWLIPYTVMPELNINNAGLLGWDSPLYFFLAVASIHVMTTIPDREGDLATGKKTIATIMSIRTAKILALAFMAASAFVANWSNFPLLTYISIISSLIILASVIISSDRLCLFATKLPILLLTLLAGFYFPAYIGFIVVLLLLTRIYYLKRFGIKYPQAA